MKKISLFILFCIATLSANAQLKVNYNGRVCVGDYYTGGWNVGLYSKLPQASSGTNIGLVGVASVNSTLPTIGTACGVYGMASNNNVGMNYGVAGALSGGNSGAGLFGATQDIMGYYLTAKYAGYFLGNIYVSGTLNGTIITQTSDIRLKDNITSLSSREESTLDKLLNMNVVEYNYKPQIPSLELPDSVPVEDALKSAGIDTEKKHIGLIAQELQAIYPELVIEGGDGYLSVNYMELVPVLIRSIQELKQELDEVKGINSANSRYSDATSVNVGSMTGNVLYQNTPNPFKEQTTIRFKLADGVRDASVCIFDMTGKMLKKLPVSSEMESISIGGNELGEGMFLYSLIVNGQAIDTKRMVITK